MKWDCFRYEMQTNKPILPIVDSLPSSAVWNAYIANVEKREGTVAWYSSSWMLTECYMYRRFILKLHHPKWKPSDICRIAQALALSTPSLESFDVFRQQKQEGFASSLPSMLSLASWLLATLSDVLAGEAKAEDIWNILLQVIAKIFCHLNFKPGVPVGEQMRPEHQCRK